MNSDETPGATEYVYAGDATFSCSCVDIAKYQAFAGGESTLADVSDDDFFEARKLTDLIGAAAVEWLKR